MTTPETGTSEELEAKIEVIGTLNQAWIEYAAESLNHALKAAASLGIGELDQIAHASTAVQMILTMWIKMMESELGTPPEISIQRMALKTLASINDPQANNLPRIEIIPIRT